MAQPIVNFAVVEVAKPNIGKRYTLELDVFKYMVRTWCKLLVL